MSATNDNSFNDSFEDDLIDDIVAADVLDNHHHQQQQQQQQRDRHSDIFDKLFGDDFEDESILLSLSTNESLPEIVLNFDEFRKTVTESAAAVDDDTNLTVEYILGLTRLMQKLAQIDDTIIEWWIRSDRQSDYCLLTTLFRLLPNCYREICLPKLIDLSRIDQRIRISFYEFLCFNICQLVATLGPDHYPYVEELLFENLLSDKSVCNQLASDVLCFVCRLSPSTLCYHYCSVLFILSKHIDDTYLLITTSLINRLLPILTANEFHSLINDYDLFRYSRIWRLLRFSILMSAELITDYLNRIITESIDNQKPINSYEIQVLSKLCNNCLVNNFHQKIFFDVFVNNFINGLSDEEPQIASDFINLLTTLLSKQINDNDKCNNNNTLIKLLLKLTETIDKKLIPRKGGNSNLVLTEKILKYLVLVSLISPVISGDNEEQQQRLTKLISRSLKSIYKNNSKNKCFYLKYLTLKYMKENNG
ncbi:uncharacterized protein LOC128956073 [Oppia nitens]|uniref:uncharacterized protein LOC128956073 n=1 Tax=Oppia nitens TaxID=1686743 RepID=UPI0023DCE40D|nr:uncharacterized protein LOC128956073 [Oppia nitens]